MNKPLPPALQAAQKQAAIDRGDPLPVDLLDLDDALEGVALGTAIASLEAQDKAQQPTAHTPLTLQREQQTALLRWLNENNLLRVQALPLPANRVTLTAHNTQHTWGTECWAWLQDHVGVHAEHGTLPKCWENPNRNDIVFTWPEMRDCNDWIAWAKAMRTQVLARYPTIQCFVEIEF